MASIFSKVHSRPKVFETASLFLWLGLPTAPLHHKNGQNGAFRKRFSNRRNLKTPAFRWKRDVRGDGKPFKDGAFSKTMAP